MCQVENMLFVNDENDELHFGVTIAHLLVQNLGGYLNLKLLLKTLQ